MVKNNSDEFLNRLNLVIEQAKEMVSGSPKVDTIQNEAVSVVDGFFEQAMKISPYQGKMLPKYIELCKREKKGVYRQKNKEYL